ncbi:uncharacterized protein LOC130671888 [Microplitis mediator]|uniref:uncharacterized protein LOC130671888 n=1 Tax=Microplitis mediator TaxID=375433 RepID=UPI0025535CC0|nr:uncharacterized protein LOC130671888 [Microplitis mediator]
MPKTTSIDIKNIIIAVTVLMCITSIAYGVYEYWKKYLLPQSNIVQAKTVKILELELNKQTSLTLRDEDAKKVAKYKDDHNEDFLDQAELNWGDDSDKFVQLCKFATRMLKFYDATKPESKKYLEIANFIILKINERVFKKDYTVITKDTTYETLIHLTRLLNTFEYLADDTYRDTKDICHKQILYLMPEYNRVYQETSPATAYVKNEQIIYTIIPRLLTNLKFNKSLYNYDVIKEKVLEKLKQQVDFIKLPENAGKLLLRDYHLGIYEGLEC